MSVAIFKCSQCHNDCKVDGLAPYPPGRQDSFGVAWKCHACNKRYLDVCNLGPLAPAPANCLNCGEKYVDGQATCPGCGLSRADADAFLRIPARVGRDMIQTAHQAFLQGRYQHGLALLNRLLQYDRGAVDAWLLKYRFYQKLGFWQPAQKMFEQALAMGAPSNLWFHYGSVLVEARKDKEAVTAYQRYLDTSPQDPKSVAIACSELGNAFTRLKDYPAASRAHQKAIAALPTYAPLYLNYADTFIKQHKWEDAHRALDAGLSHAKGNDEVPDLLEAKGHVLAGQMRGEEALKYVQKAMSMGADSARTHYLHGRVLALIGELEQAHEAMSQALKRDPQNADAQRALAQIDEALRE